ncbi:DNA polymerase beta superfamily protein [Deinococcus malanensis]|uniref:DNA polymerase beta superfamily protein n=1 Tax=Deinococcus malanensis TaxID=1706855 RepID=UPI0036356DC7
MVHTSPEHAELRHLAAGCVTRHHAHHYLGFSANQWRLFAKESPQRLKPLLYTFRTVLTGLYLMRTGETQANLSVLNEEARLPYLDELIARKRGGAEKEPFTGDVAFYEREVWRLTAQLEDARDTTHLPDEVTPETKHALSDLLVTLRLKDLS